MKLKKTLLMTVILVFSLASSVFAENVKDIKSNDIELFGHSNLSHTENISGQLSTTLDAATKFRNIYGLNTSTEHLNYLYENQTLETDFEKELGFPLTTEEKRIVALRNNQLEVASNLRKTIEESYYDIFGGTRFDLKTGVLTVFLTNVTDEVIKLNSELDITFEKVEYSLKELSDVQHKLKEESKKVGDLNIHSYTINESKNRVVVYSDFDKEVNLEGLKEIVDPQYISFEKANFKLLNFDLELGEYIHGRNGPLNLNSTCSSGFYATNSSDYAVLVTAGHCNRIGIGLSWYKGHYNNGDFIGNFGQKVASTYQNSDASTILLSQDVNITPKIGYFSLDSVKSTDETFGQTMYYKGYVTGANFGTYDGGICISKHGDPDMGMLCDLGIIDGVSPQNGDSGGIVFTVPSGARLYGIITGGLDTNNDGTYDRAVYSRINYIYNDLSLNSIIVD